MRLASISPIQRSNRPRLEAEALARPARGQSGQSLGVGIGIAITFGDFLWFIDPDLDSDTDPENARLEEPPQAG